MSFNLFFLVFAYIISMFIVAPFDSNLVFLLLTGNYSLLYLIGYILNEQERELFWWD